MKNGDTPLQLAVSEGRDDIALLLCSWGANISNITEGKTIYRGGSCYWKDKGVSERDLQLWQASESI